MSKPLNDVSNWEAWNGLDLRGRGGEEKADIFLLLPGHISNGEKKGYRATWKRKKAVSYFPGFACLGNMVALSSMALNPSPTVLSWRAEGLKSEDRYMRSTQPRG